MHQVLSGDAESARCNLLHAIAGLRLVAIDVRIFAAFAGVAARAQAVHGDGESAMRFRRNRAQRHGLCAEAAEQRSFCLDCVERHGISGHDLKQVADGNCLARISQLRKRAEIFFPR